MSRSQSYRRLAGIRRIFAVAVLCVGALCQVMNADDSPARAKDRVLLIESGFQIGSALVVATRGKTLWAVTADHVIRGSQQPISARAHPWPDLRLEVRVLERFRDSRLDLAILELDLPQAVAVSKPESWRSLEVVNLALGNKSDHFRFIGHPSEPWIVSSRAELQGVEGPFVTFHYHCADGLSGGAVFDEHWRLVAMPLRSKSRLLCESIRADSLFRVLTERWNLKTSWRLVDSQTSKETFGSITIPVYPAALKAGPASGLPRGARLNRHHVEALASDLEGVAIAADSREAWRLSVEILDYSHRRVSEAAYGVSVQSDVFEARMRVELLSRSGAHVFSKTYPVEWVDYEGGHSMVGGPSPPISELMQALVNRSRRDIAEVIATAQRAVSK